MPKKSFTIFLAKEFLVDFSEYLSDNARAALPSEATQRVSLEGFGDRAEVFVFRGPPNPPKWLSNLSAAFPVVSTFNTLSGAAILLFQVQENAFAVTFSHGWMYLNEDLFQSDFGLRVAVNGLDHTKLRRLERSNLGDAIKGVAQSAFQREFRSFGIDDALDLVQKISGATKESVEADAMAGARSLKITGEYDYADLPELATELLALYESDSYKGTEFRVIDSVRPMTDGVVVRQLNEQAAALIRQGSENFELGLPTAVDREGFAFKFIGPGLRKHFPDLLLRHYVAALGEKIADLDVRTLDSHKIEALVEDDLPNITCTVRKALVGSVVVGERRYAINEGLWFRIDDNFRIAVEQAFDETHIEDWGGMEPDPIATIYDDRNNGKLESEFSYNQRIAHDFGYALLDGETVSVPNVSRSGFEPCDLLDIANRRFIHVKKSSRTSSVLSHFFKQGSNSAQQFKKIPAAWTQLVQKLRDTNHGAHADALEALLPDNLGKWSVEFWIIDTPRVTGEFNIPFFSKISLRDERLELHAMEYGVALRFIGKPPEPLSHFER